MFYLKQGNSKKQSLNSSAEDTVIAKDKHLLSLRHTQM